MKTQEAGSSGTPRAPGNSETPRAPGARHAPGVRSRNPRVEARRVRGGSSGPVTRRLGPVNDRPLRLALLTTAVLTVGTIFGATAFHVMLVQSQFRLDRLNHQARTAQQHYEQLRLDVAQLSAPERVMAAAQQRLGMVVPPNVAYLMAPAPNMAEPLSGAAETEWSRVKPHLAAQP